ncbi:glycosyltransferase family 4 protein [Halorubrum ezzemoulense]|uniref:glycosyltransferase family 4 protein n=1 Tax=Halorubrum ezzemoulense TaxID=337243 RepID=UPI0023306D0C|nr:glycosyltransferase family 4 protein [Halorubrum ezzemoulense]MDB9235925.1 glycosyltransferase family 4 protein [Halorubrum ezzemoulense]
MSSDEPTVFVFSTHDISTVQGTTEAYYVSMYFGEMFDTHVIGPLSEDIKGTETHSYSSTKLFGLLYMNIILLPKIVKLGYTKNPDILYVYRNVIIPPIVLKILFNSELVTDLRVHPVEQPKEFNNSNILSYLLLKFSWVGHAVLLQYSNIIITLSKPLRKDLTQSFNISKSEIYIIPLGADVNTFAPVDGKPKEGISIAYVGSIKKIRGIDSVFNTLNQLSDEQQSQVTVELFGPSSAEYIQELENMATKGEYSFIWHGFVQHKEIPTLVGQCDCAISPLPSNKGFEVSSPAKIYEYLSLGLPIIATKITPHERILEHEVDSLLVEPKDTQEMAKAIERLLTDEDLREELGSNARTKGIENSWDRRIETILEVFSSEIDSDIYN